MRYPKTLGSRIDMTAKLRNQRLALDRQVKELKAHEAELADLIVSDLKKARIDRASGKAATFSYQPVVVGKVNDWDKFYTWISKTRNFDLLERRVSHSAYREHLVNGDRIDGIESDQVIKTSLTKLSKK